MLNNRAKIREMDCDCRKLDIVFVNILTKPVCLLKIVILVMTTKSRLVCTAFYAIAYSVYSLILGERKPMTISCLGTLFSAKTLSKSSSVILR